MIAKILGDILLEKNWKIATAESCTGGLIGHYITNVPGASHYFGGGIIAYSNEIKRTILGVSKETLEKYGAVSKECAKEMVIGVTKLFQSEVGIATTGVAGPGGETSENPIGLVYIGIKIKESIWINKYLFEGNRITIKENAAKRAIEDVVYKIKSHEMI